MAVTAAVTAALLAFTRWLERRTLGRTLALGAAGGVAVLAKFSAGLFLPASGAAILAAKWAAERGAPAPRGDAFDADTLPNAAPTPGGRAGVMSRLRDVLERPLARRSAVLVLAAVAFLVVWAGYRFHVLWLGGWLPLPAPEFVKGLYKLRAHNAEGHQAYLLGQIGWKGWWYFFPVTLAVKTPIPFLALAAAGAVAAWQLARARRAWQPVVPALAALAIVAASMPANINIGLRHVLPLFPLLAISAGLGVVALWGASSASSVSNASGASSASSGRSASGGGRRVVAARALVGAALVWELVTTTETHPDYLAYFNAIAVDRPDRIVVDSDLDWGQDLLRLRDVLGELHVDSIALAYFGTANPERLGLPRPRPLRYEERPSGWVAASEAELKGIDNVGVNLGYRWLDDVRPFVRVGKSIRLYYFPPPAARGPAPPNAPGAPPGAPAGAARGAVAR
jgi:hypothetical protein